MRQDMLDGLIAFVTVAEEKPGASAGRLESGDVGPDALLCRRRRVPRKLRALIDFLSQHRAVGQRGADGALR